ncbi:ABC transporter C family member 3-like protein [Tanacetum coccineum]|uniref:ABC transporter C family member 3-like protein n=1 Tax=Tanacetum coccineum TaxID=301880 RepID=A0ABQ5IFQ8_9ASTR
MKEPEASFKGIMIKFLPLLNLLTDDVSNFHQTPRLLHGFSESIYLGFFLLVFVTWLNRNFRSNSNGVPKEIDRSNSGALCYKHTLFCCITLVLLNIFMCLLNLLDWYRNGRTNGNIITVWDTLLGTFDWLFVAVYVHAHVSNSREYRYPCILRVWWVLFFSVSSFCLVLDYVYYKHDGYVTVHVLFFDASSTFVSLFLCYVGFSGKSEGETINHSLQESLLNGESETADTSLTPARTTSVFSLLTFSWIHPLISKGYKKSLDLEDVPELDSVDNARASFSVLRNKLESYKKENSGITALCLAKAVIWTTWKDIIITGLLAIVFTLASYVGPFLMDAFVEYLHGEPDLSNGFLLVSAFFVAKIVECLAQRHQDFKLQQAGMRARSALVTMIYHKGLTLSSLSKQRQSNGEIINLVAVDAERIGEFSRYMHNPCDKDPLKMYSRKRNRSGIG